MSSHLPPSSPSSSTHPANPPHPSFPFRTSSSIFDSQLHAPSRSFAFSLSPRLSSRLASASLSLDDSAPLPAPIDSNNIWAHPAPPSNSSAGPASCSDYSPLPAHPPTLMSTHLATTQSMISSPVSLLDFHRHSTYTDSLSPSSATSAAIFAPHSLPSTFYSHDSSSHNPDLTFSAEDERAGRSRARDILGARVSPIGRREDHSVGSPASSSARSGIGLSNMSPFTGTTLLPSSTSSSNNIFGGPSTHASGPFGNGNTAITGGFRSSRIRDSSLGAIGTGRTNVRATLSPRFASGGTSFMEPWGTAALSGGRSLSANLEEEEDEDLAGPGSGYNTRSGATSRRHSVAACSSLRTSAVTLGESGRQDDPLMAASHRASMFDQDDLDLGALRLDDDERDGTFEFGRQIQLHVPSPSSSASFVNRIPQVHSGDIDMAQVHQQPEMMPWARPIIPSLQQPPPSQPQPHLFQFSSSSGSASGSGPGGGRKSSFSAGDPFSASAQAAKHFATAAAATKSMRSNRFPPFSQPPPSFTSHHLDNNRGGVLQHTSGFLPPLHQHSQFGLQGLDFNLVPAPPGFHHHLAPPPTTAPLPPPTTNLTSFSGLDPAKIPVFYPTATNRPSFATPSTAPPPPVSSTTQSSSLPPLTSTPGPGPHELSNLGKGVPLTALQSANSKLYIVEFKDGRADLFYRLEEDQIEINEGEFVVVEADRGKDLGRVVGPQVSVKEVWEFQCGLLRDSQPTQVQSVGNDVIIDNSGKGSVGSGRGSKEIYPKRIYGKATSHDVQSLIAKSLDESKALNICQNKVLQRGLKMEIRSAEWQWDRRKLTFFFVITNSDHKRIDFRDLVKDLFRTWKTRIWMCSVNNS